jgi:hypothetical protein
MPIQVKFRRGTATQHNSFTGANGEITVDTTNKTLRVHDNSTVGGIRLARFSELSAATNLLNVTTDIVPTSNIEFSLGTPTKRWKDLYLLTPLILVDLKLVENRALLCSETKLILLSEPLIRSFRQYFLA